MPPQSRGSNRLVAHSLSTPNLPTISPLTPLNTTLSQSSKHPEPSASTTRDTFPSDATYDSDSDTLSVSSFERDLLFPSSSPSSTGSSSSGSPNHDHTTFTTAITHEAASASHFQGNPLPHSIETCNTTSPNKPKVRPPNQRSSTAKSPHKIYALPSRSASSFLGAPPPASFAPPFYNRPPTPLPPSPSLTSLLRPPFSTAASASASRPGTPGEERQNPLGPGTRRGSKTGGGLGTHHANVSTSSTSLTNLTHLSTTTTHASASSNHPATAISRSALHAPSHIPRASPPVPTYEYYGFVLYLTSSFVFGMYLLWSFLPTPFLHQLGLYYYPDRWWSLAVPAWLVVAVGYVYVALAGWNWGVLTPAVGGLEGFVDRVGVVVGVDGVGRGGDRPRRARVGAEEKNRRSGNSFDERKNEGRAQAGNGTAYASTSPPSKVSKSSKHKHKHKHKDKREPIIDGAGVHRNHQEHTKTPSKRKIHSKRTHSRRRVSSPRDEEPDWRNLWNHGTDAVMDVPIGGVCEILYGAGRSSRSSSSLSSRTASLVDPDEEPEQLDGSLRTTVNGEATATDMDRWPSWEEEEASLKEKRMLNSIMTPDEKMQQMAREVQRAKAKGLASGADDKSRTM